MAIFIYSLCYLARLPAYHIELIERVYLLGPWIGWMTCDVTSFLTDYKARH